MSIEEVEDFHVKGYEVATKSCRKDAAAGGVLILVRTDLDAEEIEDLPEYRHLIDVCSIIIYPNETEADGIRISGVYISPSATARAEDLTPLTSMRQQSINNRGEQLNHLILGDLNPNSWKGDKDKMFQEWLAEQELWELTNPAIPTHNEGSALDKVLLLPGAEVLWDLLPPEPEKWKTEADGGEGRPEDDYHPAETYPCSLIADHSPVFLRLRGSASATRPPVRKLRVTGLTKSEWADRNEHLEQILKGKTDALAQAHKLGNTDRYYTILLESMQEALADYFWKTKAPRERKRPYETFCEKHVRHPDIPQLIKAIDAGEYEEAEHLTRSINREHWKEYLASAKISDISGMYDYLAKAEGRKPQSYRFACTAPLTNSQGDKVIKAEDKCDLLADYFQDKLTEKALPKDKTKNNLRSRSQSPKSQKDMNKHSLCSIYHFGQWKFGRPYKPWRGKKQRGLMGCPRRCTNPCQYSSPSSVSSTTTYSKVASYPR